MKKKNQAQILQRCGTVKHTLVTSKPKHLCNIFFSEQLKNQIENKKYY